VPYSKNKRSFTLARLLCLLFILQQGCSKPVILADSPALCRQTVGLDAAISPSIRWTTVVENSELSKWCNTVGPAVVFAPQSQKTPERTGRLIVVDWNVHVGYGKILDLIALLSKQEEASGFGSPQIVMLLQESIRRGVEVPASGKTDVPQRIPPPTPLIDIEDVARELGWWMYYVPSMRNGNKVGDEGEDRGNAVLSTLPLGGFEAVELPFVVQRRTAVIATVGAPQKPLLRVAVVHLDTRAPVWKGWIFGGPFVRKRQAKGLVAALEKFESGLPLVIGADLNSHAGRGEAAVDILSKIAPRQDCGSGATHASGLVLDHIFTKVPDNWAARCERSEDMFGSDHRALILRFGGPFAPFNK
jgi:endonuclease/exonuclease/phosphatase family metal-dependent hydrolase